MVRLIDLRPTHESFMSLERYLNDGSPSGFSFENTPSPGFRALDTVDHFDLPIFDCTASGAVNVGDPSTLPAGELPVHPEMADLFAGLLRRAPHRHLPAAATSSGRTLSVTADGVSFYAKVAYQRLLGRVTRKMTRAHVLSAIEVSSAYEYAIASGRMPPSFHLYRERCGLCFPDTGSLKDWAYVERDIAPHPAGCFIEVPAFSLIATPRHGAPSLLQEMLDCVPSLRTMERFFDHFIKPLLDLYFSSVIAVGLQPEAHAQNVVFLLDNGYVPVGIALRDMESVDKDLPVMEVNGLQSHFTRTGYKFLSQDAYNYQIMHSFMYDFKLGEYLLKPLVKAWANYAQGASLPDLELHIRAYAQKGQTGLPDDFFPKDVWYDYEPVVHEGTAKRRYREHPRPRFR